MIDKERLEKLVLLYNLKEQYCDYCYKQFVETGNDIDSAPSERRTVADNYLKARAEQNTVVEVCDILGIDIKQLANGESKHE